MTSPGCRYHTWAYLHRVLRKYGANLLHDSKFFWRLFRSGFCRCRFSCFLSFFFATKLFATKTYLQAVRAAVCIFPAEYFVLLRRAANFHAASTTPPPKSRRYTSVCVSVCVRACLGVSGCVSLTSGWVTMYSTTRGGTCAAAYVSTGWLV